MTTSLVICCVWATCSFFFVLAMCLARRREPVWEDATVQTDLGSQPKNSLVPGSQPLRKEPVPAFLPYPLQHATR